MYVDISEFWYSELGLTARNALSLEMMKTLINQLEEVAQVKFYSNTVTTKKKRETKETIVFKKDRFSFLKVQHERFLFKNYSFFLN